MILLDWIVILLLILGAFKGYRDGFLLGLFTLTGIVLGILGGFKLLGIALIFLDDVFSIDQRILPYAAFGIVFILILVMVTLLGRMLKNSIDKSFLGRVDQAAGAGLGVVKSFFVLSVVLWITSSLELQLPEKWSKGSVLVPYLADFAPGVTAWIGKLVPAFKDIFR